MVVHDWGDGAAAGGGRVTALAQRRMFDVVAPALADGYRAAA